MRTQQEKIINKFEDLSLKYHKLSLLFNELAKSLKIKNREFGINSTPKKFKEYLKSLNLDIDKLMAISTTDIKFTDLKVKDELKGGIK